MEKPVFIIVNSQEYICDKKYIMEISPTIREYFENNPKEENFICNIDSFQGNECFFKDFLNGKHVNITYDIIPFIISLSKVFKLNCFDEQLKCLNNSFQNIIKNVDANFLLFENNCSIVLNESFESISQIINQENYQFLARTFLSLFIQKSSKIGYYKSFLNEQEKEKNIPIYQEFEKLLGMKHFLYRVRNRFLSNFHSPLFLKHFDSEIKFEIIKRKHNNFGK